MNSERTGAKLLSRKHWIVLCLVAGLAVAGIVWFVFVPRPGITIANFERVQRGMTEDEVDAILGLPGKQSNDEYNQSPGKTDRLIVWDSKDVTVFVFFDKYEERVVDTQSYSNHHDTAIARVRAWLGL
jgi:hypothetical protein